MMRERRTSWRARLVPPNATPLQARHPYLHAHQLFVAGLIPRAQAAAMMAADREFIAECELSGSMAPAGVLEEAQRIVREVWSRDLVRAIQATKQPACDHKRQNLITDLPPHRTQCADCDAILGG